MIIVKTIYKTEKPRLSTPIGTMTVGGGLAPESCICCNGGIVEQQSSGLFGCGRHEFLSSKFEVGSCGEGEKFGLLPQELEL